MFLGEARFRIHVLSFTSRLSKPTRRSATIRVIRRGITFFVVVFLVAIAASVFVCFLFLRQCGLFLRSNERQVDAFV